MPTFHCPHCDQPIAAEDSDAGAATLCPACEGEIVVPELPSPTDPDPHPKVVTPQATESPSSEEGTVADRIKAGASAGWSGVKRHTKQAALLAQIEKLKNVDLRKAHHALGEKCYEARILEVELADQYEEIRAIETKIAQKREKEQAEADETKMAALKRMGKHAAKAGHAQVLVSKREHLLSELGKLVFAERDGVDADSLSTAFQSIEHLEREIQNRMSQVKDLGTKGSGSRASQLVVAAALILVLSLGGLFAVKGFMKHHGGGISDTQTGWPSKSDYFQKGQQYHRGEGVPQDYEEALKWYRKAAEEGDPRAQDALATMYFNGEGVGKDRVEALVLWSQAASQGLHEAQYKVGSAHKAQGNKVLGYFWLNLAASSEDDKIAKVARKERDDLARKMSPEEIREGQKLSGEWYPNKPDQPGLFSRGNT